MTKMERLKQEAATGAMRRGHILARFESISKNHGNDGVQTKCKTCGMTLRIYRLYSSAEPEIYGEAIALNCPGENKEGERG